MQQAHRLSSVGRLWGERTLEADEGLRGAGAWRRWNPGSSCRKVSSDHRVNRQAVPRRTSVFGCERRPMAGETCRVHSLVRSVCLETLLRSRLVTLCTRIACAFDRFNRSSDPTSIALTLAPRERRCLSVTHTRPRVLLLAQVSLALGTGRRRMQAMRARGRAAV